MLWAYEGKMQKCPRCERLARLCIRRGKGRLEQSWEEVIRNE